MPLKTMAQLGMKDRNHGDWLVAMVNFRHDLYEQSNFYALGHRLAHQFGPRAAVVIVARDYDMILAADPNFDDIEDYIVAQQLLIAQTGVLDPDHYREMIAAGIEITWREWPIPRRLEACRKAGVEPRNAIKTTIGELDRDLIHFMQDHLHETYMEEGSERLQRLEQTLERLLAERNSPSS